MSITYGGLFAANLRAARARAGLSQTTVAKRMKRLGFGSWSGGKVSECERGDRAVVMSELLALSIALECTINELVGAHAGPADVITFPDARFEVRGVTLRNSVYGWKDHAVTWDKDGEYPVITSPANPFSAAAEDRSQMIAQAHPSRLVRFSGGVIPA